MHPDVEAVLARARGAGVSHRIARAIGGDGRTVVLEPHGIEVVSFASCSYLNLDQDPRLAAASIDAIGRCGVAFSASRCVITSPLYAEAETLLTKVFGRPVVLAGSTTLAHGAALPVIVDARDVVLFDRQVHHSVQLALATLGSRGPRCVAIAHGEPAAVEHNVRIAIAGGARRVWYCADGIAPTTGERLALPLLRELMERYPSLHAYIDDAQGMSWCGPRGTGTVIEAELPGDRTVIATSLGKGFGCAGGLVAVPDEPTRLRIENVGPSLMFGIQIPPPVLGAICASAQIHLTDELPTQQRLLAARLALVRELIRADPLLAPRAAVLDGAPTPMHYLVLGDPDAAITAASRLLELGFLVRTVTYPAVPLHRSGLRFAISRVHTEADVRGLIGALATVAQTSPRRRSA
jgi:7-keto-8-aminopelargonate synthetase-like enzyme